MIDPATIAAACALFAAACALFAAGWVCRTAFERRQSRWQRHPPYSSAAIALSATEGDSHRPDHYSSHPRGGPCTIGLFHCDYGVLWHCECGALWVDVPITNQPPEAP